MVDVTKQRNWGEGLCLCSLYLAFLGGFLPSPICTGHCLCLCVVVACFLLVIRLTGLILLDKGIGGTQ